MNSLMEFYPLKHMVLMHIQNKKGEDPQAQKHLSKDSLEITPN